MSEFPVITRYEVHGAEEVIRTNALLWGSYRKGTLEVKEFTTALRENMEGTYAMRRAYSGIRMAIRVQYAELFELGRAMMAVGRIGRASLAMWQAYTLGQMRVSQAMSSVSSATEDVAKWQSIYNQYLKDFGSESAYTKDALDKLTKASDREADALERAAKAVNDMYIGYLSIGMYAPTMVAGLFDVFYHVKNLQAMIAAEGGLTLALKALSTTLSTTLVGAFATAGTAFTTFLGVMAGGVGLGIIEVVEGRMSWGEFFGAKGAPAFGEGAAKREEVAWYRWIPIIGDLYHAIAGGNEEEGQFGIFDIPRTGLIKAHRHEKLVTPFQAETGAIHTRGATIQARITQYNTIYKQEDAEAAADRAYRRIMEKWGEKL